MKLRESQSSLPAEQQEFIRNKQVEATWTPEGGWATSGRWPTGMRAPTRPGTAPG